MTGRARLFVAIVAVAALAAAACGGGGGAPAGGGTPGSSGGSGAGTCEPSSTTIEVSAKNISFDKACLAAPAGQAFTVKFTNNDAGIPHNFAIYRKGPPASDEIMMTKIKAGPTVQDLSVPALAPGSYYYQCDVHPTQMNGTLVVK